MFANLFRRGPAKAASKKDHNGHHGMIHLQDVVKTYTNAAGSFTVLKDIDADFSAGEFVGIIGKSGSGKSTLVNMITGIDRPTSGEVWVDGKAVHKMNENQLAIWRGRSLGIVFQFFQLLPTLTLVENVMLPMDFCNIYRPWDRPKRARELLALVEMSEHANKLPTEISGGQQQRVAIARALANDPPILLADEPTGNLDSKTANTIFQIFEALVQQGKTVVMVTHDSTLARRVRRTILLADGEIVNEYVSRALPLLTPQQMLHATHHLKPLRYEPGATIVQEGSKGDMFYIVTSGRAEVALRRPDGHDVVVFRPGAGEYFGEIELMRGSNYVASVRAISEAPVEVVTLDREAFAEVLAESEETRDALEKIVQTRLAENIAARRAQTAAALTGASQ